MRAATAVFAILGLTAAAGAETGADHVRVDVVTDASATTPGKPFTVGVRFRIDPGWHIYWTNPGDSGTPTRVKLDLPPGWSAGDTEYPTPAVLKFPGDLTNYGYEHEVVLLVPVTPGPTNGSPPRVDVEADYLVCKDVCLPGRATVQLDPPAQADAGAVKRAVAGLPLAAVPADPLRSVANGGHGGAAVMATLRWRGDPPPDVTWIPDALDGWEIDHPSTRTEGGTTTVRFAITPAGGKRLPARVDGLLITTSPDGRRAGYLCPVTVSAAIAPTTDRSRP